MSAETVKRDRYAFFELLKGKAFFRQRITLSSGKESDYYIDARLVTLSSAGAFYAGRLFWHMIENETFDAVGGPTLGADPMIGAIGVTAHQAGREIHTFIIRKTPKAHGKQQQIEGPLIPKGGRVILIDDVATTGKAFLHSLDVLATNGITATKALCIVDRQEGAREALQQRGCELISIFTAREFLDATSA